ncbi:hypothetical protein D0T12_14780 [Actinomadura spongiicola]|uniref:Secreted protein n=1 Tax=Actinomadura spongiicola TaxID=2303421 RepID=A0A372GHC5_9ACTN|nr:hypothetical protein D0T12_14780 [Actinomadura spongiicola]
MSLPTATAGRVTLPNVIISQRTATGARRRDVAALAVAVQLAVLTPGVAHATPAPPPAPTLRHFDLHRGPDRSVPLRALDGRLLRIGVDALLGSSGQRRLGRGCGEAAAVPPGARVLCFDKADSETRTWLPQGVTSVSDATAGERLTGGGRPLLVSWHDSGRIKVTFVDPDRGTYRHVLLVHPTMRRGRPTYSDIDIHAGGIAWYGDKLYVADTHDGIREFDMRQIYDLDRSKAGSTGHPDRVGLHGDKYYGHGHRFVMPQTGGWNFTRGWPGPRCEGSGPLRMSWLGVDRTVLRHTLIAGEWCLPKDARGRVVTWPLGALSGPGVVHADWSDTLPGDRVQGGLRTRGHWWFTQGHGTKRGRLLSTIRDRRDWGRVTHRTISHGPEDLSCQRGQHLIWTAAEYARKRAIWSFHDDSCA